MSRADKDNTVDVVISPHSLRVAGRCRDEFSVICCFNSISGSLKL